MTFEFKTTYFVQEMHFKLSFAKFVQASMCWMFHSVTAVAGRQIDVKWVLLMASGLQWNAIERPFRWWYPFRASQELCTRIYMNPVSYFDKKSKRHQTKLGTNGMSCSVAKRLLLMMFIKCLVVKRRMCWKETCFWIRMLYVTHMLHPTCFQTLPWIWVRK